MTTLRRVALIAVALLVVFVAVTLVALEGSEVVVLHTALASGEARTTRVWIADYNGVTWIESASLEREFYRDILVDPNVELSRHGDRRAYRAAPLGGRGGHELIRRLLREKYGWADFWIGLFADTSSSIAVRLLRR